MTASNLLHGELSYKIVGVLFDVYNKLGAGYQEKYYQKAIAVALKAQGIRFSEQVAVPLKFMENPIGRYLIDFVIEDSIVLEIKSQARFHKRDTKQVLGYLNAQNLELGILAAFATSGLIFKRILRGWEKHPET